MTRGDPGVPIALEGEKRAAAGDGVTTAGSPHESSHAELLHELGYSLEANAKTIEGASHPDRNAQVEYINERVKQFLALKQPVIR